MSRLPGVLFCDNEGVWLAHRNNVGRRGLSVPAGVAEIYRPSNPKNKSIRYFRCRTTQNYLPMSSSCSFIQVFGPRPAARTPAHSAERRVKQERAGPYRLRTGKGACAVASWALRIGFVFFVAHEKHRPGRGEEYLTRVEAEFDGKKEKGTRHRTGPPSPQSRRATYPFVTTGGGALPLPTCAQPVMLRSASTAAIATVSFFIGESP